MFKIFKSLLNLFQKDGPITETLFWPESLFFRGISKVLCDLVLYISGGNKQFIYIEWWSLLPIVVWTFFVTRCSTLSFVGGQFISFNYLAPIWGVELSLKEKRIHLFRVTCIFFLIFLLTKGYQKIHAKSRCGWIKELRSNMRNFGFRNSFCLYKNCNLIFLRHFIAIDSPLKLLSR